MTLLVAFREGNYDTGDIELRVVDDTPRPFTPGSRNNIIASIPLSRNFFNKVGGDEGVEEKFKPALKSENPARSLALIKQRLA